MDTKEKLEAMIAFCESKKGCPYIWGANGPNNFDCSGLAIQALKNVNFFPQGVDENCKDLFLFLSSKKWLKKLDRGSVLFFGKSIAKIEHVGIALDLDNMISAAGGDRFTRTLEQAKQRKACVKVTPIRKDLIAYLYPC